MLLENNVVKTNLKEIATIMNNFFINITNNLDLWSSRKCATKDLNSTVSKYDTSIKKIKESFSDINVNDFQFEGVTMEGFKKAAFNLNIEKSSCSGLIPAAMLKQSLNISLPYLAKSISYTINEGKFPDQK